MESYNFSTNWILTQSKSGKKISLSRASGFVEMDGKLSNEEDFANNIEYYIFDPTKLKSVTPNAYEWIKKKFGDSINSVGNKK